MATINKFEDLEIWQIARRLSLDIFTITCTGAFSTDFKLSNQIRGAGGSVMDNIAEGFERSGKREFINFLSISKGSTGEIKSQLYRAMDQGYILKSDFEKLYNDYNKLGASIAGFIAYLNKSLYTGQKFRDRT